MDDSESLSHSKWECKYHVIFIPKCRRKTLYEQLRPHLGQVFKRLSEYKESRIEEGHLMPDHCSGQVISDTTIGFFAALFRSKTEGDRLPNTECIRLQL